MSDDEERQELTEQMSAWLKELQERPQPLERHRTLSLAEDIFDPKASKHVRVSAAREIGNAFLNARQPGDDETLRDVGVRLARRALETLANGTIDDGFGRDD